MHIVKSEHAGRIHPTAIIDPTAELAADVTVGAYSIIGPEVALGPGCEVMNHVTLHGPMRAGRDNRFYPFGSIGLDPQDKKYGGEAESYLEIGDANVFREYVTVNRGSVGGGGVTRIGSGNWFMAYCHVAHDCQVGDCTVFANGTTLGGHVTIGDNVTLGGFTAVHQFCSIGELTITGGMTMVAQDVPPFVVASGNRVKLYGVNKVGLRRNDFSREETVAVERAYKLFYRSKLAASEAMARIEAELSHSPSAMRFLEFVRNSKRGICR